MWRNEGPVAFLLNQVKGGGDLSRVVRLRPELKSWLCTLPIDERAVVVPVPASQKRLRERGFHLAALMARWAASALRAPLGLTVLRQTDNTQHLTQLDRQQRFEAAKTLYAARRAAPTSVLLVDDVITTGATATACAHALAAAGCRRIWICALARTPTRRRSAATPTDRF